MLSNIILFTACYFALLLKREKSKAALSDSDKHSVLEQLVAVGSRVQQHHCKKFTLIMCCKHISQGR